MTRRIDVETPEHDVAADLFEWSEDGTTLATAINPRGAIQLFDADLHPGRLIDLGEGGDVFDLSFSPDGTKLAAVRNGGATDGPGHDDLAAGARARDRCTPPPRTTWSGCPTATRS